MDRTTSSPRIPGATLFALFALSACTDELAVEGGSTSDAPPQTSGSTETSAAPTQGSGGETGTGPGTGMGADSGASSSSSGPGSEVGSTDAGGTESGSSTGSTGADSTGVDAVCGDGVVQGDEACDGAALDGATCPVFGEVSCAADCSLDLSGCDDALVLCSTPEAPVGAQQTPMSPLVDSISVDPDFFVVDLEVTLDITHPWVGDLTARLDAPLADASSVLFASACGPAENVDARFDDEGAMPICGNFPALGGNIVPLTELRDLVGLSSAGVWSMVAWDDAPFAGEGTLHQWCLELTLANQDPVVCGDGVANYGEACDGADLDTDCAALDDGFVAGEVACADDCTLDTTGCVAAGCGNGVLEPPEACDGVALGGSTCSDFAGFDGPGLACADDCTFDTTGCEAVSCGDGVVGGAEVCDGAALGGAVCEDVPGYESGVLGCQADCSGYDVSGCAAEFIEACASSGAPISDLLGPTSETVSFVDAGTVADVDVFVDITHTWVGDLQIDLASPLGTTATLFDGCGDVDDLQAVFDDEGDPLSCGGTPGVSGSVVPAEALSAFDGEPIAGDWALSVTDEAAGDNGALNAWCVQITPDGG